MTCAECQELLLDLAYGELDPARAAEVEAHVQGCAACQRERAQIAGVRTLVAPLMKLEEPSAAIDEPILRAARAEAERLAQGAAAGQQRAAAAAAAPRVIEVVGAIGAVEAAAPVDAKARVQRKPAETPKRRRWMLRAAIAGSVAAAAGLAVMVTDRHAPIDARLQQAREIRIHVPDDSQAQPAAKPQAVGAPPAGPSAAGPISAAASRAAAPPAPVAEKSAAKDAAPAEAKAARGQPTEGGRLVEQVLAERRVAELQARSEERAEATQRTEAERRERASRAPAKKKRVEHAPAAMKDAAPKADVSMDDRAAALDKLGKKEAPATAAAPAPAEQATPPASAAPAPSFDQELAGRAAASGPLAQLQGGQQAGAVGGELRAKSEPAPAAPPPPPKAASRAYASAPSALSGAQGSLEGLSRNELPSGASAGLGALGKGSNASEPSLTAGAAQLESRARTARHAGSYLEAALLYRQAAAMHRRAAASGQAPLPASNDEPAQQAPLVRNDVPAQAAPAPKGPSPRDLPDVGAAHSAAAWDLAHAVECLSADARVEEARRVYEELLATYPRASGPHSAALRALRSALPPPAKAASPLRNRQSEPLPESDAVSKEPAGY